jgi:ribosomal protein S18 acetylase RimI-like enzyme
MNAKHLLNDITFTENGPIDVAQLNRLYHLIGWDTNGRRTDTETAQMLRVSHYHVAAHTSDGLLVGFARVCGDPYVVQVLDVITHPDFRQRGIATRCMQGVLAHLQRSLYVSVTLTDGSGIEGFYQRFGFHLLNQETPARVWKRGTDTFGEETEMDEEKQDSSELLKHFGSVIPNNKPEDFQAIRVEFENSVAQEVISEDKEA